MELKYGLISADDHVQEHPEVWTSRMSKQKWGDGIPHVITESDGSECWVVGGQRVSLPGVAIAGALMGDPQREPRRWEEVPPMAYDPAERLKAMDLDHVDYSVLYPIVGGLAAESFGKLEDPDLELACVQAYNDWLIEEWASISPRFVPQCIVPIWPMERTVAEIKRAVAKGHKGVIYPASPMELRAVPHVNEPAYDPLWAICEELECAALFSRGSFAQNSNAPRRRIFAGGGGGFQRGSAFGQFDCRAGKFSFLARALPFSESKSRVCRKLVGLGRLRDRVRRLSIGGRRLGVGRIFIETLGAFPAPVLFYLLVRSRESAGSKISRHLEHSMVDQLSAGQLDLAQFSPAHRCVFRRVA